MVRLVLCLVFLAVGAIGKEILGTEDSFINDKLSDVKDDIPNDIPEEENAESIPMNGNSIHSHSIYSQLSRE